MQYRIILVSAVLVMFVTAFKSQVRLPHVKRQVLEILKRDADYYACGNKCNDTPLTVEEALDCYDKCDPVTKPGTCARKCTESEDRRSGCVSYCWEKQNHQAELVGGKKFTQLEKCDNDCYFQNGTVTPSEFASCSDKCDSKRNLVSCYKKCDETELTDDQYGTCNEKCDEKLQTKEQK